MKTEINKISAGVLGAIWGIGIYNILGLVLVRKHFISSENIVAIVGLFLLLFVGGFVLGIFLSKRSKFMFGVVTFLVLIATFSSYFLIN